MSHLHLLLLSNIDTKFAHILFLAHLYVNVGYRTNAPFPDVLVLLSDLRFHSYRSSPFGHLFSQSLP